MAPASLAALFRRVGLPTHPRLGNDEAERKVTCIAERGSFATIRRMMRDMPRMVRAATLERSRPAKAWTAGKRVVSVGFGSMTASNPQALLTLVRQSARHVGGRVVLLTGWSKIAPIANDNLVHFIKDVPHGWLFSKMAATVQHGGASTTGAALAVDVPSPVVPFAADQPFRAAALQHLVSSPGPVSRRRLTSERLSNALTQLLTESAIQTRAAQLGQMIKIRNSGKAVSSAVERMQLLSLAAAFDRRLG